MKKKKIYDILFIMCLSVFLFSAGRLITYYFEYKAMDKVYVDIRSMTVSDFQFKIDTDNLFANIPEVDMNALKEVNNEIVGYILIPDTNISYPIAYSEDEYKYLNYDIRNNKSRAGAIFVEASDQPNFEDDSVIIHGHNMHDGTMFSQLNKYVDEETFFLEHPYVFIYTNDYIYLYRVFNASNVLDGSSTYRLSFASNASLMSYIAERVLESSFEPEIIPNQTDSIITLSTCSNLGGDWRAILQAYLVEKKEL